MFRLLVAQRAADAMVLPAKFRSEAIKHYLKREEKREEFRQDAAAAWAEYQATGLHVTAEEAEAWLTSLEAGDDAAAPECHV